MLRRRAASVGNELLRLLVAMASPESRRTTALPTVGLEDSGETPRRRTASIGKLSASLRVVRREEMGVGEKHEKKDLSRDCDPF
uniref:Uncharacterized protein n=1 Tax=Oryza sativa subsp. japonica TaxID=39947 RepID=Q6Z0H2_ORYSJ|nr:hypothetical protein [Oryza sativa Japonica Group]BAD03634.1 hypothetical protein [Oryza sativa Japonica Group]